ncbi:MAG: hypothetical protein IJ080_01460, partial [Oscillospiraceae bacterium]|nr:hypothetical protein [Oscillospiraceae bacterium]
MNKTIKKAAVTVMMTAFAAAAALPLPAYAPFGVSVSAEEETVIELSSEEDINAYFRQGGSPKGGVTGTFKLMNDIELNNYFPIRDANNVVIDLNEHKISRRLSDATGDGCVFLVQEYSECTVELRNGTISGGKNIGSGGGIFVQTGEPVITLTDMTVTDNSCTGNGGGVYMGSGDLTVYGDTIISSNVAENNGGGIYTESSDSLALADGITIMGNTAGNNGGGVWSKSSLEVNGANITNNTAANAGGGIYIPYSSSATTLTLSSGNITANSAQNGGGVYSGMPINIDGAIAITDNIASKDGGGIYGTADAPISITGNVEISGNNAVNGGGLYSIGTINVQSNVTISGNKATDNGGGVFAGAGINASTDMYITDNYKTNTTRKSNVYLSQGIITLPSMPLGNTKVGV